MLVFAVTTLCLTSVELFLCIVEQKNGHTIHCVDNFSEVNEDLDSTELHIRTMIIVSIQFFSEIFSHLL